MPRTDVQLTLTSIGYSGQRIGNEFMFKIVAMPDGRTVRFEKKLTPGKTATYTRKNAVQILDAIVDATSIKLEVEAVEGEEKDVDRGKGSGSLEIKPDASSGGFVNVTVVGDGEGDEGMKALLQLGFILQASAGPERIAALCKELRDLLGAGFGRGAPEAELRLCLLRIAWHESGLTTRAQSRGPARGVYQMQRPAALNALDAMRADPAAYGEFARAAGISDLNAAVEALRKLTGNGFGTSAIGGALETSDRAATLAAIWYLGDALRSLPALGDIPGTATFWENNWRRVPDPVKREQFIERAARLDTLRGQLPAQDCGTKR